MRIAPAAINSCGLVRGGSLLALSAAESVRGRETTRTMETVKFELARSRANFYIKFCGRPLQAVLWRPKSPGAGRNGRK